MAKGIWFGVGGKARKVKNIYIGIGGKARRVKKAYIGVGGKARLFWSGGEIVYNGTPAPINWGSYSGVAEMSAASNSSYALFAGGAVEYGKFGSSLVTAYNNSLTKSTPTSLQAGRGNIAAASLGNYALFAGGHYGSSNKYSIVDAYNTSLTRTNPAVLNMYTCYASGTSLGNYALFGGGCTDWVSSSNALNAVTAYNASLTKSTPTALIQKRFKMGAASNSNYAIFAGGTTKLSHDTVSYEQTTVDAYNTSLVRSTPTALSVNRQECGAARAGNYILIAGGNYTCLASTDQYITTHYTNTVDTYNGSLTRGTATALPSTVLKAVGTTLDGKAIFCGHSYASSIICWYDESLVRYVITPPARLMAEAAASVGNYALFGNGYDATNNTQTNMVQSYKA